MGRGIRSMVSVHFSIVLLVALVLAFFRCENQWVTSICD